MKTEFKKVYYCEHCKKHMLSAASMSRHEKFCKFNPENKTKCFEHCIHLVRDREFISGYYPGLHTTFECLKTGKGLYSYQFEKNVNFKPEYIKGLFKMPKNCLEYQEMTEEEYNERYWTED